GDATMTASARSSSAPASPVTNTPGYCRATRSRIAAPVSHTAASSASASVAAVRTWFRPQAPAPITPILSRVTGANRGSRRRSRSARGGGLPQGAARLLVAGAAGGAGGAAICEGQPLPALAHPADAARGHTHHEAVGGHVCCDHRAGPDEGVLAQRHAAHDRGVGTNRAAPLHQGATVLMLARDMAARVQYVGEHAGRAAEDVVFELDALVDRHVVL